MKKYEVTFGKKFNRIASKKIRSKEDLIYILLEAIELFLNKQYIQEETDSKGKLVICIDKMSRMFIFLEDKYYSFEFPFYIYMDDLGDYHIMENSNKDNELDVEKMSILHTIFREEYHISNDMDTFFYEEVLSSIPQNVNLNDIWSLVVKLLTFEGGYIRYDDDKKHEPTLKHPHYHYDVCYDSSNQFKLGLENQLSSDKFMDFLNIQTDTYFIKKN